MPSLAQANDQVLMIDSDERRFLVRLLPGQQMHTHHGFIPHDAIIGQPFGTTLKTQKGYAYILLQPSTYDLVTYLKRSSQIIFPKEIGYIIVRMNIIPGARIVEAGTGSGGLTLAMARCVQPNGRIFTYEERDDMQQVARKNLERAGVLNVVEMKQRDIRAGFDERDADALFLDVREPWLFLAQAHAALKGGGFFGSLVPTTNQLSDLLQEMENLGGWGDLEVIEIMMRHYKPVAERLRPEDRMIAHTGYLLFARAMVTPTPNDQTATRIESQMSQVTDSANPAHLASVSGTANAELGEPAAANSEPQIESEATDGTG